ncbi:MAG: hypothetical protein EOP38_15730 [Rubrivivax sp.]|nr:MAG: hypothetical protein EOP38_15730 [Rubrivivax sp.]
MTCPSTVNTVFASGLDGYHFVAMRRKFADEQIIQALGQDIRDQNPQMAPVEALREACSQFAYLQQQVVGNGSCRRVHQKLQRQSSTAPQASMIGAMA